MILVDIPRWPAHGRVYGHLVSDESLLELHRFAARIGLHWRAFDHDHYDLPDDRLASALAAGATPVDERELVQRLAAAGLRVRRPDKVPRSAEVLPQLRSRWAGLHLPEAVRDDLLVRWSEPHRHYHDVRHLAQMLTALDQLCDEAPPRAVALAAWFHDAIYEGVPGTDERQSADLAREVLDDLLEADEVAEVERLVLVTATHSPAPDDPAGALVSDADLAVLGQPSGRYDVYVRDVRSDYAHVPDAQWRTGRLAVLDHLLSLDPLYRTADGRALWLEQARTNLQAERQRWSSSP